MNKEKQPYDVAAYVIASKLLSLLVDKGIVTPSEGTNICTCAKELLPSASAMRATSSHGMQLEQLLQDVIDSFPSQDQEGDSEHQTP